jgi:transcriptional regulator with XRE-family HTH domain
MGRALRQGAREVRKGPLLLEAFLAKHNISLREAAEALGMKHPSVWVWVQGRSVPEPSARKRIAIWTNDEVPEASWLTRSEIADTVALARKLAVKPFKASGTDR